MVFNGGDNLSNLLKHLHHAEYYIKEFSSWNANEIIVDDDKAFWSLQDPESKVRKVCMFRDGHNVYVYGDYGEFTFDSMTWKGSVYNLYYDNIGYQMEKLSNDSRKSLYVFEDEKCREDIIKWLKNRLYELYDLNEKEINKVVKFMSNDCFIPEEYEIEEFCQDENWLFPEIEDLLQFTRECLNNVDEDYWIQFLRDYWNEIDDFDDPSACELWNAGKCVHQRYFICMYALKVCAEKLREIGSVYEE